MFLPSSLKQITSFPPKTSNCSFKVSSGPSWSSSSQAGAFLPSSDNSWGWCRAPRSWRTCRRAEWRQRSGSGSAPGPLPPPRIPHQRAELRRAAEGREGEEEGEYTMHSHPHPLFLSLSHTHTHTHTKLQQNLKPTNCECNMLVVSGQWGVNPSPEWQRDYSIRSLERLWSADSVETISLSLFLSLGETLSFRLLSPMKLAHPDHSNYRLTPTARARKQWERQPILSSPLYKQPHRHYRCRLLCTFD